MKTKTEIKEWVEGQFYSDVEEKELCESYEDWGSELVETEVDRMTESLCRFLKVEK